MAGEGATVSKYRVQVVVRDERGRIKAGFAVSGYEWDDGDLDNAEWFAEYLAREATAYVKGEESRL